MPRDWWTHYDPSDINVRAAITSSEPVAPILDLFGTLLGTSPVVRSGCIASFAHLGRATPGPQMGPGVVSSLGMFAGLCVHQRSLRSVAGEKLLILVGAPGVGETESDQDGHDGGEGERCDRAPESDGRDQAESVGLEQQATERGALEDASAPWPQPRCRPANPWAAPAPRRSAPSTSCRHRCPEGARR